jgi:deoxyribonuclease-4
MANAVQTAGVGSPDHLHSTTPRNTSPSRQRLKRPPNQRAATESRQPRRGPLLGAHMSIAGGHVNAVHAAVEAGCDIVQVFTKNNNQWYAKPLTDVDVNRFAEAVRVSGLRVCFAHNSYLINLASPDPALWKKSIDALVVELQRCELLGLRYLVSHPGSHLESSIDEGLRRVAAGLDEAHRQVPRATVQVLLEITAGQGTNLGHRFEHLAQILEHVREPDRVGICFDTCHAFAAGYAMGTPRQYEATMGELDRVVGLRRVKAIHLNDSKRELGSRVDRHEHIGRGHLGLAAFRCLLNDPRFRHVPMCLETPKGSEDGTDLDVVNLATLRGLVKRRSMS